MRQETVAMDEQVETELRLSHAASAMDAELFRKMSLRGDSIHGTPIQVTPRPLSSDGLAAAAGVLGVPAPVLWTVVAPTASAPLAAEKTTATGALRPRPTLRARPLPAVRVRRPRPTASLRSRPTTMPCPPPPPL